MRLLNSNTLEVPQVSLPVGSGASIMYTGSLEISNSIGYNVYTDQWETTITVYYTVFGRVNLGVALDYNNGEPDAPYNIRYFTTFELPEELLRF